MRWRQQRGGTRRARPPISACDLVCACPDVYVELLTVYECMWHDRRTVERAMRFVMEANPRHAKFAARLIACMKDSEKLCAQIVEVRVAKGFFGLALIGQ